MLYGSDTIYLDHAAGSPPAEDMFARWQALCRTCFANPHGTTSYSAQCKILLNQAERQLLEALNIPRGEAKVIWVSGGTEALNLAIHGVRSKGLWLVDKTAHAAVLGPVEAFAGPFNGLATGPDGCLSVPDTADTTISALAVTHVNNETGVIQNLVRLREQLSAQGQTPVMLVDALQSAGKIPVPWEEAHIDMLAVGGRKVGGPAGIGALIIRRGVDVQPLMFGGGQQEGLRPGTVDVPAAALFAEILTGSARRMEQSAARVAALKALLVDGLKANADFHPHIISPLASSPYITCLSFPGFEGAVLMRLLAEKHVIVGSGSACSAEAGEPSHVLMAMGCDAPTMRGALRISFSPASTRHDAGAFLTAMNSVLTTY